MRSPRLAAPAIAAILAATAPAQDTTFTYQGLLEQSGVPADGIYTMAVSLWNAPSGGAQQGPTATFPAVAVQNGRFTIGVDVGNEFDGAPRWVQVAVNGVTLAPRQPVTGAPASLSTRGLFVNDAATRVGIGNTNPIARLHVTSDGVEAALRLTNGGPGGTALIAGDVTGSGRAATFYGITSSPLISVQNDGSGRAASFVGDVSFTGGPVSIGTSTPKGLLRVEGDYYGLGHLWLHAFEGDGQSGIAYVQARDDSGNSTISLILRTQVAGNFLDAMRFDGARASMGGPDPHGLGSKFYVGSADSVIPLPVLRLDRTAQDGTLISFYSLGAARGSVTVSGNTVSYNAFTGSHHAYPDAAGPIQRSTLVRMTGRNRASGSAPGDEVIYGVAPTTTPNDPACLGAYLAPGTHAGGAEPEPDLVMAAGNGDLWVVDSGAGDLTPGDPLISSHVPGCAMKDDPARFPTGHVVARCAQRIEWAAIEPDADGARRARVSVLFGAFTRGPDAAALARENEHLRRRLDRLEARLDRLAAGRE